MSGEDKLLAMPPRVVTTVPAATEIVAALGIAPAGISHECDYPPTAAEAPVVTTATERGAFRLRGDRVTSVGPDIIVCQGTCDVCAIDRATVQADLAELPVDPQVVSVDIHQLEDLYAATERVGAAVGREDRAEAVTDRLQARVDTIERQAATLERPRVVVFDWMDPVMVAGHWVPELVVAAGGAYELEQTGQPARRRSWDRIREYDPEVVIVAPCGYGLDQTETKLGALTDRPGWAQLTAVQNDAVYLLDGDRHVNRPGPRLPDTLRHLAGLIHPGRFTVPPRSVARHANTAPPAEQRS